jgi:transcriptional antiterminator RfaH
MQPAISYNTRIIKRPTFKPNWHAVYTRHCHEKKVFEQLKQMEIEAYLPLYTTIRQWKDRKKKVSLPLFSCYIFVYITKKKYYDVLNIPGVVRFVIFEGKAVAIPEKQIQLIKNLLEQKIELEELPGKMQKGKRVQIKAGPLTGITGELIDFLNNRRVVLQIEEINKSLLVNIPMHYLKPLD